MISTFVKLMKTVIKLVTATPLSFATGGGRWIFVKKSIRHALVSSTLKNYNHLDPREDTRATINCQKKKHKHKPIEESDITMDLSHMEVDVLQEITEHLLSYDDYLVLKRVNKHFRKCAKDVGASFIVNPLQEMSGLTFSCTLRALLVHNLQIAHMMQAMVIACDHFIFEFERAKCYKSFDYWTPYKLDLAYQICPTLNELRANSSLVQSMAKKLAHAANKEANLLLCKDKQDALRPCLWHMYFAFDNVSLSDGPRINSHAVPSKNIDDKLKCFFKQQNFWVPVLDSDAPEHMSSLDRAQTDILLTKIHTVLQSYKTEMNKSVFYDYEMYRKDIRQMRQRIDKFSRGVKRCSFGADPVVTSKHIKLA